MKRIIFYSVGLFILVAACQKNSNSKQLFRLVASSTSGLDFSNDLPVSMDLNIFNYMYYYNGGGTGVADLNNDGWTDIIFTSNVGQEKVYLNKGGLQFEDISAVAQIDGGENSWTNGVAIADVNKDGLLDVYLAQVGTYRNLDSNNKLFICTKIDENGVPHYEEQAAAYGLDFKGFSTQAGFFDFDLDGDLDMFLMNHSLHHNGTFGQRKNFLNTYDEVSGDRLYRNDDGKFTDITKVSGIHSSVIGYGLGLAFGDVNNDGYPDIYVGNDFHENDYLYINQGDGTFKDELTNQIKHTSRFSMGVDIADVNNDGWQDIVSLDMLPEDPYILKTSEGEDALDIFNFKLRYGYNHQYARNALQLNQGNNHFKEIGAYAGIHATDWSWASLFFDFDMDGQKDLFISNGIPKRMNDIDYIDFISGNDIQFKIQFDQMERQDLSALDKIPEIKLYNKFYKGTPSLQFEDLATQIGRHQLSYSNSAAYADFDQDGDYDLVCNNIDAQAFLYENTSKNIASTRVLLNGNEQNKQGIGSKIIAYYKDKTQHFQYFPTRGFQSSMLNEILLPSADLDSIRVIWPDQKMELKTYSNTDTIAFKYEASSPNYALDLATNSIALSDITATTGIDFKHKENPFVEFNRESLIPFSTSAEGPALAVGDVNGDGLEDFFVGSAKRKRNGLYIQQTGGTFIQQALIGEPQDTIYEEVDATFADIDLDGDQDLLIATGGNEFRLTSPYTQPLLFRNEGGQLTKDATAFEGIHLTASCIALHDVDADGDLDAFIGGRAIPWSYGEVPQSYLLENDGTGKFKDISKQWLEDLPHIGFVRAAEWIDMNGDAQQDLVLALEWEEITILYNKGTQFEKQPISTDKGWWNSITIADFDNDGNKDIFAANLGLNSRLQASKKEPVRMFHTDIDDNEQKEQILTYFLAGREVPFSNMKELHKQVPKLKKQFLYAKDFANASVQDLIGAKKAKEATLWTADCLENTLFINEGNGQFSKKALPFELQYTSYNTALAIDIDQDGDIDLLPGGNYHYSNVQMGRYDAENGGVLLNDGQGNFEYKNIEAAPLQGQVQHFAPILIAGKRAVLAAQNNVGMRVLEW